jgi:hypothetical protein
MVEFPGNSAGRTDFPTDDTVNVCRQCAKDASAIHIGFFFPAKSVWDENLLAFVIVALIFAKLSRVQRLQRRFSRDGDSRDGDSP